MLRRQRARRRLSMTSLIDVIFLLLLFFMLSSTFSKFSEVELASGAGGGTPSDNPPLFLQLGPETLRLNATETTISNLTNAPYFQDLDPSAPRTLLVSMQKDVTAQRLTDLLVALRTLKGVEPTILGRQ